MASLGNRGCYPILIHFEKWVLKVSIFGQENIRLHFSNYNGLNPPLLLLNPEKFSYFWYENYLVKGVFKVWVKLASSLVSLVLLASHRSVQVNQGWVGYTQCKSKPKPYPINGLTECISHMLGVRFRPIIILPRIQNPKNRVLWV